ncbi:MAG TPA: hypothetical protein VGJ43_11050 [Acidimicrobiales bacterium]
MATLEAQDPGARTASVSWAGRDPVPVWLDQARELSEYWIHRQQLRQALGWPPDLAPDLAAPVLDGLRWAWPHRLATLGARGGAVTVTVSGPVAARWHLVASPGGWDFRPGPDPAAEVVATLDLTADECWRLLTNNLPRADQVRLRVAGDPSVAAVLLRTRAIIGMPQ